MKKFIKFIPILFLSCLNLTSCDNIVVTANHVTIDTKTKERTITYSFELNIPRVKILTSEDIVNLSKILFNKTPLKHPDNITESTNYYYVSSGIFYDINFTNEIKINDTIDKDVQLYYHIGLNVFDD